VDPVLVGVHHALQLEHAFSRKHFEAVGGTGLVVEPSPEALDWHYLVRVPLQEDGCDVPQTLLLLVESFRVRVYLMQGVVLSGVSVAGSEINRHDEVHL